MKRESTLLVAASLLLLAGAFEARAAHTYLPLRYENNPVSIHDGATSQTIETSFGNNPMGLPFTNSVTFDFFSPPLAGAVNVTTDERATGEVLLTNTDTTTAHNFSATTRMQYCDYDPATGANVIVVDTGATAPLSVTNGSMTDFSLPKQTPPSDYTLAAGHQLHIALIIEVTSGDPGSYAQLLYNGPTNTVSSTGDFPQGAPASWAWPVITAQQLMPPTILSLKVFGDPVVELHCSGTPGGTYLVQATTDLRNPSGWKTIGTNIAGTNGLFTFVDTDATNYNCRFYRASTP